ncbi:hypothetical protein, partial [Nitrobacter sp.]|uniref:hypothetical protein n=1 Tax=Nitrobacter sp. TaxID=29420 RepID=UPI001AC195C9
VGSVDLENVLGQIKAYNQCRHQGYSLRVNPDVYLATCAGLAADAIHTFISDDACLARAFLRFGSMVGCGHLSGLFTRFDDRRP